VKRFFSEMNPTVRGFLIVGLIALVVVVLQLYQTLTALFIIARIAFLLAIAYFVYLVWRERRQDIGMWSSRAQYVFYGGAIVAVATVLTWVIQGLRGYDELAVVVILFSCGYSMWRTWRSQRTYS
jgi:small-conductance mechanosensitive channel